MCASTKETVCHRGTIIVHGFIKLSTKGQLFPKDLFAIAGALPSPLCEVEGYYLLGRFARKGKILFFQLSNSFSGRSKMI